MPFTEKHATLTESVKKGSEVIGAPKNWRKNTEKNKLAVERYVATSHFLEKHLKSFQTRCVTAPKPRLNEREKKHIKTGARAGAHDFNLDTMTKKQAEGPLQPPKPSEFMSGVQSVLPQLFETLRTNFAQNSNTSSRFQK